MSCLLDKGTWLWFEVALKETYQSILKHKIKMNDIFYGPTFPGMPATWDLIRNPFLLIVVRLFQYKPVMICETQDLVLSSKVSGTRVESFYFSVRSLFGRHKSISLYCNFVSKLRKCFSCLFFSHCGRDMQFCFVHVFVSSFSNITDFYIAFISLQWLQYKYLNCLRMHNYTHQSAWKLKHMSNIQNLKCSQSMLTSFMRKPVNTNNVI